MHTVAALGDRSRPAGFPGTVAMAAPPPEAVSLKAELRICSPGEILCPRCGQLQPRTHTLSGMHFRLCERKLGHQRCGAHLFIARGRGDPFAVVSALSSSADKERLLELLEAGPKWSHR